MSTLLDRQLPMWNEAKRFNQLILEHLKRRPGMGLRDVYKLLYQGIRGPEHLIHSPGIFIRQLQQEWDGLNPEDQDPLCESIRPDGKLVRVNLRPYKASGGSLELLGNACLDTTQRFRESNDDLADAWNQLTTAPLEGEWISVYREDVESFSHWLQENNYPPVHHSDRYKSLYKPAYRLIADFQPGVCLEAG
jgi:hypothetical protein